MTARRPIRLVLQLSFALSFGSLLTSMACSDEGSEADLDAAPAWPSPTTEASGGTGGTPALGGGLVTGGISANGGAVAGGNPGRGDPSSTGGSPAAAGNGGLGAAGATGGGAATPAGGATTGGNDGMGGDAGMGGVGESGGGATGGGNGAGASGGSHEVPPGGDVQELYTQTGTDPTWAELMADGALPIGVNSTGGVLGSTIDVNNARVEVGPNSSRGIEQAIRIHTLANSSIPRADFHKWTRWYQEDGNTQIFRLFEGEHNVRNTRPDAARVEAFSTVSWARGAFHEWVGTYTVIKPHGCAIFQAKNNINDWGVMLNLTDEGDIVLNHRRNQEDLTIARAMTGKPFHIKVRDNGHDYEVYLDGSLVGTGAYERPEGTTAFRWGMYDGTMRHDALLFVTGATVDP